MTTSSSPVQRAMAPKVRPLSVAIWIEDPVLAAEVASDVRDLPVRVVLEREDGSDWDAWIEQAHHAHPDVVLLGLGQLQSRLAAVIEQIRSMASAPAVVAIDTATDPEVVLGSIRAGAAEYVYPPVVDHLAAALERVAEVRKKEAGAARCGKTVAFVSAKGGCGATTVACHVAAALRQQTGQVTLLADFDLDNGVIGFLTKSKSSYSIADALQNADRLDASYWKALVSQSGGLDVIVAPPAVTNDAEPDGAASGSVLEFARSQYDWVVVDLGRGLNRTAQSALPSIDEVYVVTTLDVPALYRCQQIIRALMEQGYGRERIHLAVNRISKSAELTKSEIEQMMGLPVSVELPDEAVALGEAHVEGTLLPQTNDLAKRMGRVAKQIAGIAAEAPKKRFSFSWLTRPAACLEQTA